MSDELACIIMGAAGRDFHDFQTFFHTHPGFRVKAFTAAQIPYIEQRSFPCGLAGPDYSTDIPIYAEERLAELISELGIDFVFLAYSDLPHLDVMHKASLVQACGASFALLGPKHTQLRSKLPVLAVTAIRTGSGKSPLSQRIARHLIARGYRVGVLRHPMPYGDLARQAAQRFASVEDLDRAECTIEEREEYLPYLQMGMRVYAGVDYAAVLRQAEEESDLILWDGGNNDYSFVEAGLKITVVDALRAAHAISYYPGETNLRRADILVLSKIAQAEPGQLESARTIMREANPSAQVVEANLEIQVSQPELLAGKRALIIEDGPTLTHGDMAFGAGTLAAKRHQVREIVDPRPTAVGSLRETFEKFPHLDRVLPAMGYSREQLDDLATTVRRSGAEVVVDGSPARVGQLLDLELPVVQVSYEFSQVAGPPLLERVEQFAQAATRGGRSS